MAQRLVCTEGGSNKFWEGKVSGTTLTVRFGKVGTAGQTKVKTFLSAADAEKELAKLRKEKLGKGYVEEAGAAPATPAAPASPTLGRHAAALLALIGSKETRATPDATLAAWAAKETRADFHALWTALAAHEPGYIEVGELILDVGGEVPGRTDVTILGNTPAGDVYVIAPPGTSGDSKITLLWHDEGWSEGDTWCDLDRFISERILSDRERRIEDGEDEEEIRTDLDPFLRGPAKPAVGRPLSSTGLALAPGEKPPRDLIKSGDRERREKVNSFLYYALRNGGYGQGWYEDYWHGRHAFAMKYFEGEPIGEYHAALLERSDDNPVIHDIAPAIVADNSVDKDFNCRIPFAFDNDGQRLLVCGARDLAVVGEQITLPGDGSVFAVTTASAQGVLVREGSADVEALAWVGDLAAVLRPGKKANLVEFYAQGKGGWKLHRTVACAKCNLLLGIAGDRVLAFTSKKKSPKAKTYFVAARGEDLRLIGAVDGILKDAVTGPDGRCFVEEPGEKWSEIVGLEEAIADAFRGPPRDLILA
jgi:predicted DNA-binding WGR domain protein